MKNMLFIFFLTQICNALSAQSVTIQCTNNNCSTPVEPSIAIAYNVTYTLGQNDTFDSYFFTPVGGTNSAGSNFVTWDNTPNTNNAHTLKATVKYRNKGNKTVESSVLNVTVKHIGAITQLSIGGSGVSFSTLQNGGSVQLACGQQSLSLNVPAPITDPSSAITYTWQFPWGTQTTSTPSVSTTSNVGQTDASVIVAAKRTDGNLVQTFSFGLTRPRVGQPLITSEWPANDLATCPGEYKLYKVSATNATTFSWATISTGSIYNPTSQITMTQLNAKTTLTATVDNACLSPKTTSKIAFVGVPVIETVSVNGQPQSTPNYIMNPGLLNMWTNEIGVTYNWQITNGTGSIYYNGQNQIGVYAYPFVQIQGSITNRCGATSTTFYLYNIGGGYYRMTSPNPTTSTVSIDVTLMNALKKVTLVSNDRHGIVRMYNANGSLNGNTHRNNNDLSFDVANLPRGLYYLNFVFDGNKTFTEQIVLE